MKSLWTRETDFPSFSRLEGDIRTNTLVIGGGIAGILTAYMLKRAGVDCVILEANRLCSGVTAGTTAKITLQHGLVYDKLIRTFGIEKAKTYLDANREALENYRELARDIPCDFTASDSYVYDMYGMDKIEAEARALSRLGQECDIVTSLPLPFDIKCALRVPGQAVFNPFKLLSALADGLTVYEHSPVLSYKDGVSLTHRGSVRADRTVIATHYPFIDSRGMYFLKMYQQRSYVLALGNVPPVKGMYVGACGQGYSFRDYKGLVLFGGCSRRTGKTGPDYAGLRRAAKRFYPDSTIECEFAAQDCITLDGVPYIGKYSRGRDDLYVATGFNKWGITSSMAAATLITRELTGKPDKNAEVFSPSRSILHPQLVKNAVHAVGGLATPTTPRCTHLGCALKYNKNEQTWDCPCHGSRFDKTGNVIASPADRPAKIR